MSDRLITIAIHTYDHALALRNMLEREGISVSLQNLHLDHPVTASGLRVRINEDDLPLALRIIENSEAGAPASTTGSIQSTGITYLVPVDLTPHSLNACDLAFWLAYRNNASLRLIHAFIDPSAADNSPLSETLDYAVVDSEQRGILFNEAFRRIKKLSADLHARIREGALPPVRFSAHVIEGIPEEVIIQDARDHHPDLIVMGTRTRSTKERELIGSVTAEVLDSCRVPIITLPENISPDHVKDTGHAIMFCDMNQTDLLVIDYLYRTFARQDVTLELLSLPDRRRTWRRTKKDPVEMLLSYCQEHYPRFTFHFKQSDQSKIEADLRLIEAERPVDMIVVPNHRRTPLTRLFNPSIAHRLLFNADIPMAVIPV